MPQFSTFSAARDHVLENRNESASVVYAGKKYAEYTFGGILLSLGYDGAKSAGFLPEYQAVVLQNMYADGYINRGCWWWVEPRQAIGDMPNG